MYFYLAVLIRATKSVLLQKPQLYDLTQITRNTCTIADVNINKRQYMSETAENELKSFVLIRSRSTNNERNRRVVEYAHSELEDM